MPRIVMVILAVALWIYAIIDCARTDGSSMPGRLPKPAWLALVFFFPIVGSIVWLYFSWKQAHPEGLGNSSISFGGGGNRTPSAPMAPDDDPEFLARLDAENRFREWERQQQHKDEDETDGNAV